MAYVNDKHELKPGLVLFRRGDLAHRNWYCRIKLPNKTDRYKTISLRTADLEAARALALEHETDLRVRLKYGLPVFTLSFADVAQEYLLFQDRRARTGEISSGRVTRIRSIIEARLNAYVGQKTLDQIDHECWAGYRDWRRAIAPGRARPIVSDATIRGEMIVFGAVMNLAKKKEYITPCLGLGGKPKLMKVRRDAFTLDEYRHLLAAAQTWVKNAPCPRSAWRRTVAYNFMLVMSNTGLRPAEAKNLRWRNIVPMKDEHGRRFLALHVHGKGKSRQALAAPNVEKYLGRIRAISRATGPDDPVFTTYEGEAASTLYGALIADVLEEAGLRIGPSGVMRSTYCFRHTYATFRLSAGIDCYFLAMQMGTSIQMIEDYYGHVDLVRHADLVLGGMQEPTVEDQPVEPAFGEAA